MRRREFISLLGGTAVFGSLTAWAQQSLRPLIAVLEGASAASMAEMYDAFRAELRLLGYLEGRNCSFDTVMPMVSSIVFRPWRRSWSGSTRA